MAAIAETRAGPIQGRERNAVLPFAGTGVSPIAEDPDGDEQVARDGLR